MSAKKTTSKKAAPKKRATASKKKQEIEPLLASLDQSFAGTTSSRRNLAGTIQRTDKYKNIDDGLIPFKSTTYGSTKSISVKDAVILCQKAYYNFAIFRNTIDLMTEFSVSPIYYRGGTKRSRKFFEALFNKINIWDLQDKFFREYYRSGNCFLYRFDAKLKTKDIRKIIQLFGADPSHKEGEVDLDSPKALKEMNIKKMVVPSRYIILNPADIQMSGNISFAAAQYSKVLTDYELQRLRNPQTVEDLEVLKTFSPTVQKQIKNKGLGVLSVPLDPHKFSAIFYKRQDYEPFAVPMGYPVLEDLNFKSELKKMDMAIARTMQQAILLVTMGTDPDKGGINQKNLEAMQKLFENQSVGRVLISDYTTKANFVIPQIGDLLDERKYAVVDRDINMGINNLFAGNEKFANQQTKVEIFAARLVQARQTFINDFLLNEIKRISKSLGFKNYPTPYFEEIALRDNVVKDRIYARLLELGILTPQEAFKAIDSGILPDKESSVTNQKEYISQRQEGLFSPLLAQSPELLSGGPEGQKPGSKKPEDQKPQDQKGLQPQNGQPKPLPNQPGRPPGSGGEPQENQRSTPQRIGQKNAAKFVFSKVKENMISAQKLEQEIGAFLRKKHDIKRLGKKQKAVVSEISNIVMANEKQENWSKNISKYCKNPDLADEKIAREIDEIAYEHQVDQYLATLLYLSKA